jgi:muramoyltetrapeptide carboxypeptidase
LRGVEWWESKGYRVKLGRHIHTRTNYLAGPPEDRAADVMDMFTDPEIDVVQCFQGGYGSAEAIPFLDFDVIASNPKPFVGYSDITALHQAIRHFTGLVTFYGPTLAGVANPERDSEGMSFTQERLLGALAATEPLGQIPARPDDSYIRSLGSGRVSAELVGGCLWLLGQAIGTPWQPDFSGRILFFEDVDAPPWYIDGVLNQMKQAGMLEDVAGIAVGEMKDCDWRETKPEWPQTYSLEDILEKHIEPLGVPALYNFPLGHGKNLATLPLGVSATLDADARVLSIDEPALHK